MNRLFVYGSLAPGKPNVHILNKIGGSWKKAFLWGKLYPEGWGAQMGFPGIRLEVKVERIHGYVFYSDTLEESWAALDAFEGEAYHRKKTTLILEDTNEEIEAYIYCLK